MDVVVRTPHGDADIDIVAAPSGTTLHDLVFAVTGQSPPATARIDGRSVATSRRLDELGLVVGSLIDTRPADSADFTAGPVDRVTVGLLQLTGRGAGRVVALGPGRHRIGTARRAHATELAAAPVETTAFELIVDDRGEVRVAPGAEIGGALGADTPTLAGRLLDREVAWTSGRLHVGGRLFELERPLRPPPPRRLPDPTPDGSIPFHRVAWTDGGPRPLVIGAAREAASAGAGLWQRRAPDAGAFNVGFGIHADEATVATVDLLRNRGVALVGSERFASALARTLLVELCTMHGPADLDVVVASTDDRIGQWNWIKWLPHIRHGLPTNPPRLFADPSEITSWVGSVRAELGHADTPPVTGPLPRPSGPRPGPGWAPPSPVATRSTITLLVVDDMALWNQRESPIRSLLADPPEGLRIMALCSARHEAPGICTTLIEEITPDERLALLAAAATPPVTGRPGLFGSLAAQHVLLAPAPQVIGNIRPALTESGLASEIARHLAPLDDLDTKRRITAPTVVAPPGLQELVDLSATLTTTGLHVAIGLEAGSSPIPNRTPVTIDLASPMGTIVAVGEPERHARTVAAIVLGAAAQREPGELAVLAIGRERPSWHGDLAHVAGWAGRDEAADAPRLIHRVAHVLAENPDLSVLIVIEHAFDRSDPAPAGVVTGMTELAASLPNVHLVMTADDADSVPDPVRASCSAFVSIAADGTGTARLTHRTASFVGVATSTSTTPPGAPTRFGARQLLIAPTSHGRAMTPLERRLTRSVGAASGPADDGAAAAVARRVSNRVTPESDIDQRMSLLPPPLPATIDAAALVAEHPGDGVPIGLVDRPERADSEAYWWQPGDRGSIVAVGSPRSGMTAVIDLLIAGIAARIAADDLHIYAIEALPQRRRALDALPHTGSVVSPDDGALAVQLIEGLHGVLDRRLAEPSLADRVHLLLLIGDMGRLRRGLPADRAEAAMSRLGELVQSGAAAGINVVAVATRLDDLDPLADFAGDRLVGATTDPGERLQLGAPALGPADRHVRRCWSTVADRRVQLATPPDSLDAEVARLAPEPARQQPPDPIVLRVTR